MSENRRVMLHRLSDIVDDLWGMTPGKVHPAPETDKKILPPERPEFPPFETLWKVADESVDWTEVLVHEQSPDGWTTTEKWALYRRYAETVLNGDLTAYASVLEAVQPLADLAHYADGFDVQIASADRLEVRFAALPAYLPEGETSRHHTYLAGVGLRAARDLFALLPVTQVAVEAVLENKTLLKVEFEKPEMQKVRFAFVDPVEFVRKCGGEFQDE